MNVFLKAPSLEPIVVKLVVAFPVKVEVPLIVTLFGNPIVTVAFSEPEPDTSISLVVPEIPPTKLPVVSVPNATELAAIVAVRVALAEPSTLTLPVKSPPNVIVLAVVHAAAVPDVF